MCLCPVSDQGELLPGSCGAQGSAVFFVAYRIKWQFLGRAACVVGPAFLSNFTSFSFFFFFDILNISFILNLKKN